jgi:hypothetical protein
VKEIAMRYCPIARHFYRLRRVLMEELGLPRAAIRPSATFAELVPREQRWRVWRRFDRENIRIDSLAMTRSHGALIFGSMICAGLLSLFVLPHFCVCVPTAIVAAIVAFVALIPWADDVDPSYTLADAALGMTSVQECQEAGYRLTRHEIFLKVRVCLVEATDVPYDEVNPDSKLTDFICDE